MEYKGELACAIHTEPRRDLDGIITKTHYVKFEERIPENIYELTYAINHMREEELIKVMKCIMRVTNKRFTFDTRTTEQKERRVRKLFRENEDGSFTYIGPKKGKKNNKEENK